MGPQLKEVAVLGRSGFHRLAYAAWGSPKAQRTVVCVHGVSRNGRDFDTLAEFLAEAGAHVIAPDLPGRGRSDWLPSALHYTDRAYTRALATLIARLDVDCVDWIGTSLGGHIGMMIAAERGSPIRRLVLNDFGAKISAPALRRIGEYLVRPWCFATMDQFEAHLREALAPFGSLSNDQWRRLAIHSARQRSNGAFEFNCDPAIAGRFSVPIWLDVVLWQLWDCIECPVLIVRGQESDLLSADTVRQMSERGPSAKAGRVFNIEIAGCGHAPALMDADQIEPIRDFLFAPEDAIVTVDPTSRERRSA